LESAAAQEGMGREELQGGLHSVDEDAKPSFLT